MRMRWIQQTKSFIRRALTYLVQIIGVLSFISAFPLRHLSLRFLNSAYFDTLKINHILVSILGLLLILLGKQLCKRMRMV